MRPAPRLWVAAAQLIGPLGFRIAQVLIDTGANASIMPTDALITIGCDPKFSKERAEILTASKSEVLPVVYVPKICALGYQVKEMEVIAHDLPGSIDGILGMDFLLQIPEFQTIEKRFRPFFV